MRNIFMALVLTFLLLPMTYGQTRMQPCPDTPNCVSSLTESDRHRIEPLQPRLAIAGVWREVHDVVAGWPRTRIVEESDTYLKAEVHSRLFKFVDDLEFEVDARNGVVNVRSASRAGQWDLGVNRRRVQSVRKELARRGLIEP